MQKARAQIMNSSRGTGAAVLKTGVKVSKSKGAGAGALALGVVGVVKSNKPALKKIVVPERKVVAHSGNSDEGRSLPAAWDSVPGVSHSRYKHNYGTRECNGTLLVRDHGFDHYYKEFATQTREFVFDLSCRDVLTHNVEDLRVPQSYVDALLKVRSELMQRGGPMRTKAPVYIAPRENPNVTVRQVPSGPKGATTRVEIPNDVFTG